MSILVVVCVYYLETCTSNALSASYPRETTLVSDVPICNVK